MKKTRIAVAGAGLIGRRHIELIQASNDCELAAIVDPLPATAAFADSLDVPLYSNLDSLLTAQRPDGVILATPNQLHVEGALTCVAHGIPALIEKPVAHTLEEGKRLLAIAEQAGAKLLVGHHRAHSAILQKAREVIAEGVLGNLVAVMGSALFYKPDDYFDAAPWRRQAGGGPVLINMIHEIGNLRSLCGEIVAVQAQASSATRGFPVEDTVSISLRFASGALGTFMLSDTAGCARSWEQTSRENRDYPSYDDEDCYVLAGTQGSLSIPTMRLKYYAKREDRSWWKPFETAVASLDEADPLERQLAHFCQVIRGEAEPLVGVRDGLRNLQIVDAISEAARTGQIVSTEQL
ncbi:MULTISPECIES: Gfo/Idh/MocA family protein [unclassified Pseudomonas]|uniref:Gfo/Idh/MocA family protein n=1 Tax=unclassified Pseudomonas TaxID=196821 RepID=UPI0021C8749A|nr:MULTISPECIES: Gfo/Idh/MocA family oxidoreductase [unclassified Pseudomonas]MCU1731240.1 Gfo/Idh/MocA family oxidoreductase [Pseudomonas sp. 20P_3.2_Bac4]MCU1743207.1 Gfo/Idh/MocA family oxidoreductase [Pseudomonas sp. 20P_3.2_Bac5]